MARTCHYCNKTEDLRPYGPGGSYVCYPCATATPERANAAFAVFSTLAEANITISGVVSIGGEEGPEPVFFTHECSDCGEVKSVRGPFCDAANDVLWLCDKCLEPYEIG